MPNKDPEKEKQYQKEYRLKNREKTKQYRLKNKGKGKEYRKEYYLNNKGKMNQQSKEYYLKNIEKTKEYHNKNREKLKEYYKEYRQTEKGKKTARISDWKRQGILCFDYDLLYQLYLKTTHCEYCECELNKCSKSVKCLDHDHSITDKFNVRGVICHICNIKDVLK